MKPAAGTFPLVDNDSTIKEIQQHVHTYHYHPYPQPANKGAWLRVHQAAHAMVDADPRNAQGFMKQAHTHQGLTVEEIKSVAGQLAKLDLARPLGAAEASALKTLIDNDFAALGSDMRAMASDTKASRTKTLREEWARKGDNRHHFLDRARDIALKYNADIQACIDDALAEGIQLRDYQKVRADLQAEMVGLPEALKEVSTEVDAELRRALLILERQRIAAQRVVILARVSPEAAIVLESIPSAQDLMLQAAQQRAESAQREVSV